MLLQSVRHTHAMLELSPLVVGLSYKAFVVELILRFDVLLLSQLTKLPPHSKRQSREVTIQTPSYVCAWERSLHTNAYKHMDYKYTHMEVCFRLRVKNEKGDCQSLK